MAPPQGPPPGPPPFEPPLPVLTSMSTSIQSALKDYENATSPQEKAAALLDIKTASTKLSAATTDLPDRFLGLVFGPMQSIAVRIAIEMGLFNAVPMAGNISLADLAAKTKSDEEFVLRITRTLVACNILSESDEGHLSHTQFSGFLTISPAQAMIKHVLHDILFAHINSVDKYYAEYGFKSPKDYKNCPVAIGFGKKDVDCFEILESLPGRMDIFAEAMTLTGMFGLDPVIAAYPFHDLAPNADGVKLVDVGGGKGQFLVNIQEKYPDVWTKGSLVLEDLENVLDGGVLVTDAVRVQSYNFLEEVQLVKGSNYIFKHILHDWPDETCLTILESTKTAMKGSPSSKILICDLVLPDRNPDPPKTLRDINMLCVGGKERSLGQWEALIGKAGMKILKVLGDTKGTNNIIEVVVDE